MLKFGLFTNPAAGWLHVASNFVKRGNQRTAWESLLDWCPYKYVKNVLTRLSADDLFKGMWSASQRRTLQVWCDASKIAYEVALEKENEIIESGAWLCKDDDGFHINVAELNAVI